MTDDQRSPDLDAAIDATVRALTAVSDEAAADSLRRTRVALAEAADGVPLARGAWRWAGPIAVAATAAVLAAVAFWPAAPAEGPRVAVVERTATPAAPAPAAPRPATAPVAAASVPGAPRPRPTRIAPQPAGSEPVVTAAPRRDPLADLIDAVQQIPDDVWTASRARAEAPVSVAEVPLAPIAVNPLDTPSISTLPDDPIAPGEP